jgi:hypothetical protein
MPIGKAVELVAAALRSGTLPTSVRWDLRVDMNEVTPNRSHAPLPQHSSPGFSCVQATRSYLPDLGVLGYNPADFRRSWSQRMQTLKYVNWQDGDAFFGYLFDYPDYWTQGNSLDELKDHLADLYRDFTSGELPSIRKVDELVIP